MISQHPAGMKWVIFHLPSLVFSQHMQHNGKLNNGTSNFENDAKWSIAGAYHSLFFLFSSLTPLCFPFFLCFFPSCSCSCFSNVDILDALHQILQQVSLSQVILWLIIQLHGQWSWLFPVPSCISQSKCFHQLWVPCPGTASLNLTIPPVPQTASAMEFNSLNEYTYNSTFDSSSPPHSYSPMESAGVAPQALTHPASSCLMPWSLATSAKAAIPTHPLLFPMLWPSPTCTTTMPLLCHQTG